jgi:hypothetical protein
MEKNSLYTVFVKSWYPNPAGNKKPFGFGSWIWKTEEFEVFIPSETFIGDFKGVVLPGTALKVQIARRPPKNPEDTKVRLFAFLWEIEKAPMKPRYVWGTFDRWVGKQSQQARIGTYDERGIITGWVYCSRTSMAVFSGTTKTFADPPDNYEPRHGDPIIAVEGKGSGERAVYLWAPIKQ